MPQWDYKCAGCGAMKSFIFASWRERDAAEAEGMPCDQPNLCCDSYERQASAPTFTLKGVGFHANDYPKGK